LTYHFNQKPQHVVIWKKSNNLAMLKANEQLPESVELYADIEYLDR